MSQIPKNTLRLNATEDKFSLCGHEFTMAEFVERVMGYKHAKCGRLFDTIDVDYIVRLMDKEKLQSIEKKFAESSGSKSIGVIAFVNTMLSTIDHYEEETLYLTLGLVDLFKSISESLNMATTFKFQDITTAICERVANSFQDEYQVVTRIYPPLRRFQNDEKPEFTTSKAALIEAPIVYENNQHSQLRRLHKGKFKTDSTDHHGRKIKQAIFAREIKTVITLDSLDQKICMYDLQCELTKEVNVKNKDNDAKMDIIIFGIAWSEKQQRLGAVLKNYSMSFWEDASGFDFEKNFSVHGYTQDYQSSIWYLETHDMWITTDACNHLHCWDIANETTLFSLSKTHVTNSIFNVSELPALKLVAIGSLDKKITIWNFYTQTLLFHINFPQVGVHCFSFSNQFQVLVTAGYENNVCLYSIDGEAQDSTLLGKLRGHTSMISCLSVMEGTPMVISGDDFGMIRVWDIRNQSCIQTFECSSSGSLNSSQMKKIHIHVIVDMFMQGMVGLVGSRLNLIEFDERESIVKVMHAKEAEVPLAVEANLSRGEIVVCTRTHVRYYDISTGRCKFVFNGLLGNEQDEITVFKTVQQGQKFLLGNSRGQISLHSYELNGARVGTMLSHSNEVTHLKIDIMNKLLVSSGWDSTIRIQALDTEQQRISEELQMKRTIEHAHFEKGVTLLEVSVYHNIVFSATANVAKVFVYDYEYGRMLNYMEFEEKAEPTAICCIQGIPIVMVGTSDQMIYIVHFSKKDNQVIRFELLACINLRLSMKFHENPEGFISPANAAISLQASPVLNQQQQQYLLSKKSQQNMFFNNSMTFVTQQQLMNPVKQQAGIDEVIDGGTTKKKGNHSLSGAKQQQNQSSKILFGATTAAGVPQSAGSGSGGKSEKKSNVQMAGKYVAEFESEYDHEENSCDNLLVGIGSITANQSVTLIGEDDPARSGATTEVIQVTHLLPDFTFNFSNSLDRAKLFCATNKGKLFQFNLMPIFKYHEKIQFVEHANTRLNYNPHRSSTEDFRQALSKFSGQCCSLSEITRISSAFTTSNLTNNNSSTTMIPSSTYNIRSAIAVSAATDSNNPERFVYALMTDVIAAHKDAIISLSFVTSDNEEIMTSSTDSYVRLWKKQGIEQICALNINHPLPLQWNYKPNRIISSQKKILYAIRILDIINKKKVEERNRADESTSRVVPFIKKLMNISMLQKVQSQGGIRNHPLQEESAQTSIATEESENSTTTTVTQSGGQPALVMGAYYNPRDIKFEEIKHLYKQELLGTSLKRMEVNKRVAIAQQIWKKPTVAVEDEKRNQMKKFMEIQARGDERETIINFFDPNYRQYLLQNAHAASTYLNDEEYSQSTKILSLKLDYFSRQGRKSMFMFNNNINNNSSMNDQSQNYLNNNNNNNHLNSSSGNYNNNNNNNSLTSGNGFGGANMSGNFVTSLHQSATQTPVQQHLRQTSSSMMKYPAMMSSKKSIGRLVLPGVSTPQTQSIMTPSQSQQQQQLMQSSRQSADQSQSDFRIASQLVSPKNLYESTKQSHHPSGNQSNVNSEQPNQQKFFKSMSQSQIKMGRLNEMQAQLSQMSQLGSQQQSDQLSESKKDHSGIASPNLSVKEPLNFEKLIMKNPNKVSTLANYKDFKGRASVIEVLQEQEQQQRENENLTMTTSTFKRKKKTKDVYQYARDRQIIGSESSASILVDSIQTQATSINNMSQLANTSTSKLQSILSGLDCKLKKFKRNGNQKHSTSQQQFKPFIPTTKSHADFFDYNYYEKFTS